MNNRHFYGIITLLSFLAPFGASHAFTAISADFYERTAGGRVEVCWVNGSSQATSKFREELREFLIEQINQQTSVKLVGWRPCEELSNPLTPVGILVFDDPIYDTDQSLKKKRDADLEKADPELNGLYAEAKGHPRELSQLTESDQRLIDLVVTSRFHEVISPMIQLGSSLSDNGRTNLKRAVALHELTHVLGAIHENLHRDSTCVTQDETSPFAIAHKIELTAYDPHSAMNRCYYRFFNYEKGVVPLSTLDIEGLNILYKPSRPSRSKAGG